MSKSICDPTLKMECFHCGRPLTIGDLIHQSEHSGQHYCSEACCDEMEKGDHEGVAWGVSYWCPDYCD